MSGVTSNVQAQLDNKMESVSVTTSDNGKFLRVVDGAWAAVVVDSVEDGEF